MILTNNQNKYTKLLFINTLKYNYLQQRQKTQNVIGFYFVNLFCLFFNKFAIFWAENLHGLG